MVIFDFNKNSNLSNWKVTNDTVMGGKSNGEFFLNDNDLGVFKGHVSLENNGGFTSVKHQFEPKDIKCFSKIILKVKGDGKSYQFRVKSDVNQRHSYIAPFVTTGEWQTLEIALSELYPTFRGMRLDIGNFTAGKLNELAFLIGNKKEESFKLEIKSISLE